MAKLGGWVSNYRGMPWMKRGLLAGRPTEGNEGAVYVADDNPTLPDWYQYLNGGWVLLFTGGGGGSATLNHNEVGFGDAANLLTGSPNFIYDATNEVFLVTFGGTEGLIIDGGNNKAQIQMDGTLMLDLDSSVDVYQIGDTNASGHGTRLVLNDAGQIFQLMTELGDSLLEMDHPGQLFFVQVANDKFLSLDKNNSIYSIGDLDDANQGTDLTLDDNVRQSRISDNLGYYLNIDKGADLYQIGDIGGANNNYYLSIEDSNDVIFAGKASDKFLNLDKGNGRYEIGDINITDNGLALTLHDSSNAADIHNTLQTGLVVDFGNDIYKFGTNGAVGSKSYLEIDGAGDVATQYLSNNPVLMLNRTLATYIIGDIGNSANGYQLLIEDGLEKVTIQDGGGNQFMVLDKANNLYSIGDISGYGAGTKVLVDEGTDLISLNTNRLSIPGFGATTYLTNTAAAAGGVAVNEVYRVTPGIAGASQVLAIRY